MSKEYKAELMRTKTLCYGDDECNFIFIKYNKDEKFTRTEVR